MLTTLNPAEIPPSDRATPPCPHFGPCGGCQLQDLTYAAQIAGKSAQLRALLDTTGFTLPDIQLHASPPLAYRNRIRLTLRESAGQLRAGYLTSALEPSNLEPRTSNLAFLPITQCPIAAPILWHTAEALLAELNQRAPVWLERAPFTPDQLELFATPEEARGESRVQLSLFVRTSAKSLPARFTNELASLCESLRGLIPELAGAGIYPLPTRSTRSRRVEQSRPGPTWGAPGLNYTVAPAGTAVILSEAKNPRISPMPLSVSQPATNNQQLATVFWVPRGAFFQINRFLLPELLAHVTRDPATNARTGTLAWDLYAGVGLFTRALAPHFARITAVEPAEPAFTALASTKLPNRHAVKETTLDFLRSAVTQRDRPDLIVIDPPRTGAEVCDLLGRIAAPTLIYVSCSPETLPADLATLAASGYRVDGLHLFDLFPQTTHIETVAVLTR
jgi:23S rRNA (uracil1939-C5)-methyltransferase